MLINCGCCATDSNLLQYILDGDYDEIGYVAFSHRDGNGHVFSYILQDGWYYVINLTHQDRHGSRGRQQGRLLRQRLHPGRHPQNAVPGACADCILERFDDPPGLIVGYTAGEVPAADRSMRRDGSVEIVYTASRWITALSLQQSERWRNCWTPRILCATPCTLSAGN